MKLSSLTDEGIREFRRFLEAAKVDPSLSPAHELLLNPTTSVPLDPAIEVDPNLVFPTRLALATYLSPLVDRAGLTDIESRTGFWSWLALCYFDEICPPDADGLRGVGQAARYLFNDGLANYSYLRSARHLIFCPVHAYSLHRSRPPMCLLCQPPNVHPDMAEQLFSSQELIAVPAIVQLADRLYYDPETDSVRRGATDRKKPGTVRRLVAVCDQLDLTYDLAQITSDELASLLPLEFHRWLTTHSGS